VRYASYAFPLNESPGLAKENTMPTNAKRLIALFIFCAVIIPAYGAPVPVEIARRVSTNWFAERSGTQVSELALERYDRTGSSEEPLFYIFNTRPEGFVLVAAENSVVPILGYGFDHAFSESNHPPQFDAMLESFEEQIRFAKENSLRADTRIETQWSRLSLPTPEFDPVEDIRDVSPLMAHNWNQNWPWNAYCPADPNGPGDHAYAGCAAIAIAQVMKYWNHPAQGEGQHSYYHPDYGTQSANFGATTYDWTSMNNNSATNASKTLIYHCGVALDMDYGPNGSGAYPSDMVPVLKQYFRYCNEASFKWKSYYSNSTWEGMIRSELDNGRPLAYCGYGTGGHGFNLDGYQGTSYFHFNWGWSGYYNGYYYLNDLTPGGYNFTDGQGGSFDLYPDPSSDTTPPSAIADLSSEQSGSDIILSWSPATDNIGVVGYWVYRGTGFFANMSAFHYLSGAETLTYTAQNACGDPNTNYVFDVRATDAADNEANASNRVGAFDFAAP